MEGFIQVLTGTQQPLSAVTMVMFLIGLDVRSYRRKTCFETSRTYCFYQKFIFVLWLIYFAHVLATIIGNEIISRIGINSIISRKLPEIIAFLVWAVLMTRRKDISILLHDLYQLGIIFNKEFRPLWINLGAFVSIITPLMSWSSIYLTFGEDDCKSLMTYYSLNFYYAPEGKNCRIIMGLNFFYHVATYTLPTTVAVTYVIICHFLSDLLKLHARRGSKRADSLCYKFEYNYIRNYLMVYEYIIKALKSLERTLSLPIFLIEVCDCMGIFYGFVKLDSIGKFSLQRSYVESHFLKITFVSLRALVSYLCVSFAASSIHDASKNAKDVQEEMLKRILVSEQKNDSKGMFLLFVAHNGPPFTLSAWGFFNFTKGTVLATAGSILTYSLLMLQIAK
ncbi:uncharacterized protein NPIL_148751 [Nephila pilipes]|uniref:Gustatory receptor n=1 Tax=Nephila pilipes TaxID=299642 RepID=A0A8X6U964_NEPPI|nr:uncharacterized protein NPIL_148751 [Nephila pilipes]